jgi:two-component system sensor kinase FixL
LLSSIIATVPDALVVIDTAGAIQSFGAGAQTMFGYEPEEVLGRNVSMLMPDPTRSAHDGYLARYLQTGERHIIGIPRVVSGQRKDGTVFSLELTIGEVKLPETHLFTGFLRDLTEREDRERRERELHAELAHVSRLTDMGQLASALAHEVNQPLTALANYLGGVRRLIATGRAEAAGAAVKRAIEQSDRARRIVDNLREFVRRGSTQRRVESLKDVIEAASALAMVGAPLVQLKLELDGASDLVRIDRVQIQQVLFNLLRNAAEAMRDSTRREITIHTAPAGEAIEISVTDTGPGLPEQVRANLFKPFTTTKPDGMGLGLSICRGIILNHGGELRVETADGGGTRFRFTIPSAPATADEAVPALG